MRRAGIIADKAVAQRQQRHQLARVGLTRRDNRAVPPSAAIASQAARSPAAAHQHALDAARPQRLHQRRVIVPRPLLGRSVGGARRHGHEFCILVAPGGEPFAHSREVARIDIGCDLARVAVNIQCGLEHREPVMHLMAGRSSHAAASRGGSASIRGCRAQIPPGSGLVPVPRAARTRSCWEARPPGRSAGNRSCAAIRAIPIGSNRFALRRNGITSSIQPEPSKNAARRLSISTDRRASG